ncbi:MAG: sigma-54-dependent Fis family transcriptional regulator [Deltaproteobacteria bacterium]|nr:MAG: sigma-54-dependent Fis family transcriptional regulator [Deltaproteobacteria bacterium]
MKKLNILVVDDQESTCKSLSTFLRLHQFQVSSAESGKSALEKLRGGSYQVVLTDYRMTEMDGIELTKRIKEDYPQMAILVMTAYGTIKNAVEAMKAGAFDYLTKPLNQDELLLSLERIGQQLELVNELSRLREKLGEKYHFKNIIGNSEPMQKVYKLIEQSSRNDATVLITGETGTGKELVARAIHFNSERKNKPMVEVNCAALPENLVESELFGHLKGAFTGADRDHQGKFELADKGTIMLDEISNMSSGTQAKLLRVLQEKKFEPVGGTNSVSVDIRTIALTNEDLKQAIQRGGFREDLYYRLNVINIDLPPLRDRKADIPLLVDYFAEKFSGKKGTEKPNISPKVMDMLLRYEWPGNVRELENVVERMLTLSEGDLLPEHLPPEIKSLGELAWKEPSEKVSLKERIESLESYMISEKLREAGGRVLHTARELGIPLRTLRRKMEKYNLRKESFKKPGSSR